MRWAAWVLVCLVPAAVEGAEARARFTARFGDLHAVRALSALDAGRADEALEAARRVLASPAGAGAFDARFTGARAALAAGKASLALDLLDGLEEGLPEVVDLIQDLRAQAYRHLGAWERAQASWQQVLQIRGSLRLEAATYGIADADFALGRLQTAYDGYYAAIRRYPRSERALTARFNLGRLAEMLGDWRKATDHYRILAYGHPTHPLHGLANDRIEVLAELGLAEPPSLGHRLSRVDKLLSARSLEEAEQELLGLVHLVRRASDQAAVDYRRAQLAYRQRRYQQAVDLFRSLASGTTNRRRQLEYERWIAQVYSAAGEYQQAIDVHLGIAASSSSSATARESLFKGAWLAYNGGNHAQAMKLFGRFIETYPRDSAASDATWYLGWNAYRLGDLPTAASTFRRLQERYPTSSLAQRAAYWEGRVVAQMGRMHDAIASYQLAAQSEPLSYYGAIARQRLGELRGLAAAGAGPFYAQLGPIAPPPEPAERLQPERDEIAESGGMRPRPGLRIPWGASVFDWSAPEAQRAITLMRLGLRAEAAETVAHMDTMPGFPSSEIHYARARLLWALGDYNRAYRIVATAFRDTLRRAPDKRSLRYFQIAYPIAFWDLVDAAAQEFGISPLLILALMRQESGYDDRARSWASANGLMQIIPRTGARIAERLRVDEYNYGVLRSPEVNVRFGAWYLSQLVQKYHGNVALAVGSYNAGPVAVSRWVDLRSDSATDEFIEDIPYRETRHYVKTVLGNLAVYEALYGEGTLQLPEQIPDTYLANVDF